ncbi:MAG TPA: hypothetical protein VEB20_19100 [Azospirillaceae bacterium]|nr:hypothetical protein [Azospirillaceae bacterium]
MLHQKLFSQANRLALVFVLLSASVCMKHASAAECRLPATAVESSGAAAPTASAWTGRLYLDVSTSMAGFAAGDQHQLLADLLSYLPGTIREAGAEAVATHFVGTEIVPVAEKQFAGAGQAAVFKQPGLSRRGQIGKPVTAALDAPAGDLTVVVTDLFLDDANLPTIGASPLALPLRKALDRKLAVGILGIRVPFSGTIYDLPGKTSSIRFKGERPLFLLMVGPAERIRSMIAHVRRDLLDGRDDAMRFVMFARPAAGVTLDAAAAGRQGGAEELRRLPLRIEAPPPAFRLPRGGAGSISVPIGMPERMAPGMPGLVLHGERTVVHVTPEDDCRWREVKLRTGDLVTLSEDGRSLVLFGAPDARRGLPPGLLHVAVTLTAKPQADPELEAALAGWSVSTAEAPALAAKPPAFFPALNLARLATRLSEAASEGEPVPAGDLAVLLSLE